MSMPDLDKAAGVIADYLNQSVRDVMPIAQALSDAGLLLPDGFVAVPREPTEAMLAEGWRVANDDGHGALCNVNASGAITDSACFRIYRAMIQAQEKQG